MERMKKRLQRRRLGVYWLVAGKAKWESWPKTHSLPSILSITDRNPGSKSL